MNVDRNAGRVLARGTVEGEEIHVHTRLAATHQEMIAVGTIAMTEDNVAQGGMAVVTGGTTEAVGVTIAVVTAKKDAMIVATINGVMVEDGMRRQGVRLVVALVLLPST